MAMHTHGRLLRCLLASLVLCALTACASNPIVKTQAVTVRVPVVESVPSVLTQPVAEPKLQDGPITNRDLADWALALRQALRQANAKLHEIAGLHP